MEINYFRPKSNLGIKPFVLLISFPQWTWIESILIKHDFSFHPVLIIQIYIDGFFPSMVTFYCTNDLCNISKKDSKISKTSFRDLHSIHLQISTSSHDIILFISQELFKATNPYVYLCQHFILQFPLYSYSYQNSLQLSIIPAIEKYNHQNINTNSANNNFRALIVFMSRYMLMLYVAFQFY